jgi:hypothetical protein
MGVYGWAASSHPHYAANPPGCFVVQSGVDAHQAQPHGENTVSDMRSGRITTTRYYDDSYKDCVVRWTMILEEKRR